MYSFNVQTTNNNDEQSLAMKQKMSKILKELEQKSEKVKSGRAAEVDPHDFAFVKEKRLLQVADDGDSDVDDDVDSGDEEKRQQVETRPVLTGVNLN